MKTRAALLMGLCAVAPLRAMPSQITFQGTLKQNGVPVTATEYMQFSFVDGPAATANLIPGTTSVALNNVQVTNGLFAVQLPLDPAIPWEQYTPYIEVWVNGQTLSPNQPLNANLYAIAAIPQGLIMMSTAACPGGWTRFSALDNLFPMGGPSYGVTGGSATHTHTLGPPLDTTKGYAFSSSQGTGSFNSDWGRADHVHTVSTESNVPPYLTLIFCQKT